MSSEAERIAQRYSKRDNKRDDRYTLFDPGNLFLVQQRDRLLLAMLRRAGYSHLDDKRILEVGCGDGWWLRRFVEFGARPENLRGVDLLPQRVERAKRLCPHIAVETGDASQLEAPDEHYHIVLQSTVFSSILDGEMRRGIAGEMLRVLACRGLIIWYDLRVDNPRNPDVRGLKRREVVSLFPGCQFQFTRTTLAPPLARRLAPYSWTLCHFLSKLPFLLTHYLVFIRRRE